MTFDPYDNLPGKEDLEKAGAADWLSEALSEQRKKDAALRASLNKETGSLKAEKRNLESLLELSPLDQAEEYTPDLFAAEKAQVAKKNASLSSLVGDLKNSKAAEKEMLKKLFGD